MARKESLLPLAEEAVNALWTLHRKVCRADSPDETKELVRLAALAATSARDSIRLRGIATTPERS